MHALILNPGLVQNSCPVDPHGDNLPIILADQRLENLFQLPLPVGKRRCLSLFDI